jgi:hypothetical protein
VSAQIDSAAAIEWFARRRMREAAGMGGLEKVLNLEQERARLACAQADKTELEVARLRLELIPADVVERVVTGMVQAFRSRILSIAPGLSPIVHAAESVLEVRAILSRAHEDALRELSEYDPSDYAVGDADHLAAVQARDENSSAPSAPVGE